MIELSKTDQKILELNKEYSSIMENPGYCDYDYHMVQCEKRLSKATDYKEERDIKREMAHIRVEYISLDSRLTAIDKMLQILREEF